LRLVYPFRTGSAYQLYDVREGIPVGVLGAAWVGRHYRITDISEGDRRL
jgi:hypothetical protein